MLRGRLISNYEAVFILKLLINGVWWLDANMLAASLLRQPFLFLMDICDIIFIKRWF
ncbi:MAG: hypothetical protein JWQ54_3300 [Mucilaginibacter sp.]|nr:hypothetical protein [Mucilaginibacter sp.]